MVSIFISCFKIHQFSSTLRDNEVKPRPSWYLIYSNEIRARKDLVCQCHNPHSTHCTWTKRSNPIRWLLVSLPLLCTMYTFFPRTESWMSTSDSPAISAWGIPSKSITIIVETELCAGDCHPAVAAQPLAQLGIREASEHLHVMIGHRVCHFGRWCFDPGTMGFLTVFLTGKLLTQIVHFVAISFFTGQLANN